MNISKTVFASDKTHLPAQKDFPVRKFQPLSLLIGLIIVLAGLGVVLGYQSLTIETSAFSEIYSINQPASTSFGTIIVSAADDLIGLTSEDLAGVTHGIQNLVMADSVQIQLTVALINRSTAPVIIAPDDQFRLVSPQSKDAILLSGATIRNGELRPRSNIHVTLSFVVPRDGASYTLQYLDPKSEQIVQIDLGGVDVVSEEEMKDVH
ncbi:MAG: hypothetical protein IPJ46_14790 [Anaerolineales bacterium]|nr:hypothetical protein [Anaerolineales bacterium]